ncbi:hypothetical protein HMPREF3232_00290 [Fannyhessea vaginae]|nr:hypothetical protein HMPREF3232_00290 [Fannyhessea vaginae]
MVYELSRTQYGSIFYAGVYAYVHVCFAQLILKYMRPLEYTRTLS